GPADRRDRRVFEEFHHATLALAPDALHTAGAKERAVRMLADADVDGDGPLDRLDHVTEGHPVGGPSEDVAAVRAAPREDESLVNELLDDLLEKLARNPLALG